MDYLYRFLQVVLSKGVDEGKILFLSLIAAPEGIHMVCKKFPRVKVITSEIDEGIDESTFQVIPGRCCVLVHISTAVAHAAKDANISVLTLLQNKVVSHAYPWCMLYASAAEGVELRLCASVFLQVASHSGPVQRYMCGWQALRSACVLCTGIAESDNRFLLGDAQ